MESWAERGIIVFSIYTILDAVYNVFYAGLLLVGNDALLEIDGSIREAQGEVAEQVVMAVMGLSVLAMIFNTCDLTDRLGKTSFSASYYQQVSKGELAKEDVPDDYLMGVYGGWFGNISQILLLARLLIPDFDSARSLFFQQTLDQVPTNLSVTELPPITCNSAELSFFDYIVVITLTISLLTRTVAGIRRANEIAESGVDQTKDFNELQVLSLNLDAALTILIPIIIAMVLRNSMVIGQLLLIAIAPLPFAVVTCGVYNLAQRQLPMFKDEKDLGGGDAARGYLELYGVSGWVYFLFAFVQIPIDDIIYPVDPGFICNSVAGMVVLGLYISVPAVSIMFVSCRSKMSEAGGEKAISSV